MPYLSMAPNAALLVTVPAIHPGHHPFMSCRSTRQVPRKKAMAYFGLLWLHPKTLDIDQQYRITG